MKQRIIFEILGALFTAVSVSASSISTGVMEGTSKKIIKNANYILNPANYFSKTHTKINDSFPRSYDLRDVDGMNFISPVKNQGQWGTCWAFGSMAASEASVQYELWEEFGISPSELVVDFSELQFGWFAYIAIQESEPYYPSQIGEGYHYEEGTSVLSLGGFTSMIISLLASGVGPSDEEDMPYISKSGNAIWIKVDENGNKVRNEEGFIIYKLKTLTWEDHGDFVPYYLNTYDEDWSIDIKKRYNSKLRLDHSNRLPCPSIRDENDNYVFDKNGVDAIKSQLLMGRGVEISFAADSSKFDDLENPPYFISEKYAHYTYKEELADHTVCIVGYDDDYPVENFLQTDRDGENIAPPGNGAFIVKNSWGMKDSQFYSDWGVNGTGYFYLSYYDKSLEDVATYDFSFVDINDEEKVRVIDQHDLMPTEKGWNVFGGNSTVYAMSNIFNPKKEEIIDGVSAYVFVPNTIIEYDIYKLNYNYTDPTDGTLVASGKEQMMFAGFHYFELKKPVEISSNESYSIVVRQKDSEGNYYFGFSRNLSKDYFDAYNEIVDEYQQLEYYAVTVVNKGESFLYSNEDGGWIDETELIPYYSTFEGKHPDKNNNSTFVVENGYAIDNFPIKGYAKIDKPIQVPTSTIEIEPPQPTETLSTSAEIEPKPIGIPSNTTTTVEIESQPTKTIPTTITTYEPEPTNSLIGDEDSESERELE